MVLKQDCSITFGAPQITESDIEAVVAVLHSRWIGAGPLVKRFEARFAEYTGAQEAIAVSSCSTALFLSLTALGIGPGDEVITSDMTYCATANAIYHTGARPVLVDCHRETMNLSLEEVAAHITEKTRAIIPVHFAGRPCEMPALMDLARAHDLHVVEDCAHAIESSIDGQHCGTFGDLGCFSFYPSKNLTTVEGGMITLKDPELAKKLRILRNQGVTEDIWDRFSGKRSQPYDVIYPGFKGNMTDLQAALGLEQLPRVEENWSLRERLWERYQQTLADLPLLPLPATAPHVRHGYHLYTLLLDLEALCISRDECRALLDLRGIGTGIHYRALHQHTFYKNDLQIDPGAFANAAFISERTLSIPFSPALEESDVEQILACVTEILRTHRR